VVVVNPGAGRGDKDLEGHAESVSTPVLPEALFMTIAAAFFLELLWFLCAMNPFRAHSKILPEHGFDV
jgi:hypothetical protein